MSSGATAYRSGSALYFSYRVWCRNSRRVARRRTSRVLSPESGVGSTGTSTSTVERKARMLTACVWVTSTRHFLHTFNAAGALKNQARLVDDYYIGTMLCRMLCRTKWYGIIVFYTQARCAWRVCLSTGKYRLTLPRIATYRLQLVLYEYQNNNLFQLFTYCETISGSSGAQSLIFSSNILSQFSAHVASAEVFRYGPALFSVFWSYRFAFILAAEHWTSKIHLKPPRACLIRLCHTHRRLYYEPPPNLKQPLTHLVFNQKFLPEKNDFCAGVVRSIAWGWNEIQLARCDNYGDAARPAPPQSIGLRVRARGRRGWRGARGMVITYAKQHRLWCDQH